MITREDQIEAAAAWWRALGPIKTNDGKTLSGDRAALARLRRCSTVMDAVVEPATAKLFKALKFDRTKDDLLVRAAVLAAVLAHVRDNDRRNIALAIGAPAGGEPNDALLKPARFRALLAARTGDEVLTGFRRVVAMLDRTANVRDVSRLILGWTDDEAGDRIRTRFAFDYHGAGDFAPRDTSDITTAEKA